MRVICMILLLLPGASLTADEAGQARAGLERFADGLETFNARFNQRVVDAQGGIESEGEGQVWMQAPNRFRWVYEGEFPELIVADGRNVWQYDEMLEQVTVREQSAQAGNSPLMLLNDPGNIDEQFTVTEVGDYEGANLLSLVARDPESEFERVLLGFRDDTLVLMGLEDAFGLRTELHFTEVLRNIELEPRLFHFEPPESADVVGEAALTP